MASATQSESQRSNGPMPPAAAFGVSVMWSSSAPQASTGRFH
jgi:hypothetical protein